MLWDRAIPAQQPMLAKLPKLPRLDAPLGAEFFGLVDLGFGVGVAFWFFLLLLEINFSEIKIINANFFQLAPVDVFDFKF